eukprot:6042517-Pleurochrysis_carterae.AAC.1
MYPPSGLSDGYDRRIQRYGRAETVSADAICSSSADMTLSPLIAFLSDASDERITEVSRLYRISSCCSTVFMLSSLAEMSSTILASCSSAAPATEERVPDCVSSTVCKSSRVSLTSLVMAAFS